MVEAVSLGVAGLFSKDLLPKFFDSVDRVIDAIDDAKGHTLSKEARQNRRMERTMRNLAKLDSLMDAPAA